MDSAPLWVQIDQTLALLDVALEECKNRAAEYARAEVGYQKTKAKRALEMKADNMPVTLIEMVVKGDDEVAPKLLDRILAEALYDHAREARNVYKRKLDTLREEYQRQWGRAGIGGASGYQQGDH